MSWVYQENDRIYSKQRVPGPINSLKCPSFLVLCDNLGAPVSMLTKTLPHEIRSSAREEGRVIVRVRVRVGFRQTVPLKTILS